MKGLKPKDLLLKHGEKIGFGLIVMATIFVLSNTRWKPYQRTPQELSADAKKADQMITNSTWPAERRQELMPTKDIIARSKAMGEPLNTQEYSFSTAMYTPIYPRSEPIQSPDYLTVEDPIASADVFLLQIPPEDEDTELADASGDSEEKEAEVSEFDALKKRKPRTTESGAGLGTELALPEDLELGFGTEGMIDGMMEGETAKVSLNGEGYRFVSVRGVIDWQTQKNKYIKALHLPPDQAAYAEPDIINFEIERQEAVGGSDPWSGPWVKLDIQNSIDVLDKATDIEADTVDVTITDPVITEPLPRRVLGIWGKHATHPRVENFELSEEEIKREQLRQEKLIQAYEEMQKKSGFVEPVEEGGFSKHVYNVRSMTNEMGSGLYADEMATFESEYASEAAEMYEGSAGAQMAPGGLLTTSRSKASGRLLLFRYFDFDVTPGAVYRYRIKIEYANPNFGKAIELLASPDLAEGQTRESDWSVPTAPVQVKPRAEFYLTSISDDRSRREKVATLDLYSWYSETGTVVNEALRFGIGDKIAEEIETKVVNPLDESFDKKEIPFDAEYMVVDLRDDASLPVDRTLPDLGKLPTLASYNEVLLLDDQGNLENLSAYHNEAQKIRAQKFQRALNELGKEYEEAKKEAESALDSFLGEDDSGMMMEEELGGARPGSAASRRSRSR